MSAKYKELLAQLEQEEEKNTTSSSSHQAPPSSTTKLYPSKAISKEDEEDVVHSSSPLLPEGVSRKKRGAQQTICDIKEIKTIDKQFTAASNKKKELDLRTEIIEEETTSSSTTTNENETSSSSSIPTISLNKILPLIPSDILRDRIKQLSPIIDRLIDDWRTVPRPLQIRSQHLPRNATTIRGH